MGWSVVDCLVLMLRGNVSRFLWASIAIGAKDMDLLAEFSILVL